MSCGNRYTIGTPVILRVLFENNTGTTSAPVWVAADPTVIVLKVILPDATVLTYTYALSQLIKDSTGAYHYDFLTTQEGQHCYRFEGSGALVAVVEGEFLVKDSKFY